MARYYYTHVTAYKSFEDSFYPIPYDAVWRTEKPLAALIKEGKSFEYMQARSGRVRKGNYPADQPYGYSVEVKSELSEHEKKNLFQGIRETMDGLRKQFKEKEAEAREFMNPGRYGMVGK